MIEWFGEFFGKLIFGAAFNQLMGGGQSGYSREEMDWSGYEDQALNTINQLQNQMGQISSWGETEKNFVDIAGELDIKSATDSARTDVEDVITAQQDLDVKTGFYSSGLVEDFKENEYEDVYGALTDAYQEFDVRDTRDKANIDITTQQLLNQITNQINAISTQFSATTGEYLEFSGSGYEEETSIYEQNQQQNNDNQALAVRTGPGTGASPQGTSGGGYNPPNSTQPMSGSGIIQTLTSNYNYSNTQNTNDFSNLFASNSYGTENTPTAPTTSGTNANFMQGTNAFSGNNNFQNSYNSLLESDTFATEATTASGNDDYDWMNAYKSSYRGGNVFGQGGII